MTAFELVTPLVWGGASHLALWRSGSWLRASLFGRGQDDATATERAFQSAMLGIPLLGTVAFVLGLASGLRPLLLGAIVAALAILGAAPLLRRLAHAARRPTLDDLPMAAVVIFVLAHLPQALYPVLEHDENVYHLLLPKLYLEAHRIVPLPWSLGANMPHLVDLGYVFPTAVGGFTAARVYVLGFILWNIVGLASFGRRLLGPIGPGVLAVLYISSRLIQWHLGLGYIEPVLSALLLASLQALRSWWEDGSAGAGWVLAITSGAACASKYTVWPHTMVLFGLFALARPHGTRRVAIPRLVVLAAVAAVLVVPWLAKNAVVTGDPLFPTFATRFSTPYWSPTQEVQFQHEMGFGRGERLGPVVFLALPWHLVVDPYTGILGPSSVSATLMLLLFAAMAFPWRRTEFRTVVRVLAIAGFVFWCLGSKQTRYLTAWLPVMIVAAAYALVPLRARAGALGAATIAIAAVALAQVRLQPQPVIPVLDVFSQPKQELLARNLCFDLTEFLNREVPPHGVDLTFWENRLYFLERPFLADSAYGAPSALARLREAGDPHLFAQRCAEAGVTHVVVNSYHYNAYFANEYLYDMIDARDYPRARLDADHALFDRFVNEELDHVDWDGPWPVFRLRAATPPGN